MHAPDRFRKTAAVVVALVMLLSMPATVGVASVDASQPQPPHSFYGEATINGEPLPANTTIVAKIDGEKRGSITTNESGQYGGAEAIEDKLNVSGSEADDGKTITFYAKNLSAVETATWTAGDVEELNLTFTDTTEPVADAGSNRTVAVNSSVEFNASGSSDNFGIASYEWDFDDGTTATGEVVSHTFTETGTYEVKLTLTDEGGNTDTDTVFIEVSEGPSIDIREPTDGEQLNDSKVNVTYALANTVFENASDVEYRIDGGDWQSAEFNETEEEEIFQFQTDALDDGDHTIDMRIVDDNGEPIEEFASTNDSVSFDVDTTSPAVTLESPDEGPVEYDADTRLNFSVDDANLANVSYRVNTTSEGYLDLTDPYEIDPYTNEWTEGPTEVTLRATDSAGNVRTKTFEFRFVSPPSVDSVSPPDGALINTSEPTVVVEYSDDTLGTRETGVDPDAVELTADGESVSLGDRATPSGFTVQLTDLNIDDPDDSTHTLSTTVVDNASNENVTSWTITIDTLAPRTSLAAVPEGADDGFDVVGQNNPAEINVSSTDAHHAETVLEVRDASGTVVFRRNVTNSTGDGQTVSFEWNATDRNGDPVPSGTYEVVLRSGDAAGNLVTENTTVDVDTEEPAVSVEEVSGGYLHNGTRYANDTITVTINATDPPADIGALDSVDARLRAVGWNYQLIRDVEPVNGTSNQYEVTFDLDNLADQGEYEIRSTAVDLARNTGDDVADTTVVYDDQRPRLSSVVDYNATNETGTVTVRANEELRDAPTVTVRLPNNETKAVSMKQVDENRWVGEFQTAGSGSYKIESEGTDLSGNTGKDVAFTQIRLLSTENRTATFYNEDTGKFIEFRTDSEVSDTFVTVSENEVPPKALEADLLGLEFLTSQLGAELAGNLTNATIGVPVNEDELPENVEPKDVKITHFNEQTNSWELRNTSIKNVSKEVDNQTIEGKYWVTKVENFSTYGATSVDESGPEISRVSPDGDTVAWDTDSFDVRFEYDDSLSSVDPATVEVWVNGKNETNADATSITSDAATYTIDVDEPAQSYDVKVIAADQGGNVNSLTETVSVAEPPAPSFTSVKPANNAELSSDTERVTFRFEYDVTGMDIDTVNSTLTVTVNGNTRTVNPSFGDGVAKYTESGLQSGDEVSATLTLVDEWGHTVKRSTTVTIAKAKEEDEGGGGGGGGDGGGGGGGGGGPSWTVRTTALDDQLTIQFEDISIGAQMTADLGDKITGHGVAFSQLDVNMTFSASDFRVEIQEPSTDPGPAPAVETGTAVAYVDVRAPGLDTTALDEVRFHYSVEESALPEGATFDDVALYRYDGESWTRLDTTHHGNGEFTATSPGFSVFAVVVEQPAGTATETETPTATPTETSTPTETTESTPEAPTTTEEPDEYGVNIPGFGFTTALLALLISLAYVRIQKYNM
ncbi:MAG: PKD domain-containing protein [Halopenitus sp.]